MSMKTSPKLPPVRVSRVMVNAGVAMLEASTEVEPAQLVTAIYRAMVEALPPIPVYGTALPATNKAPAGRKAKRATKDKKMPRR